MAGDNTHHFIPPAPRTLRANFSWTVIANVVYSACQWGILAVIAKVGNPEMVGEFALALAVTLPIQAFFQMQLRGIQATDARRSFQDGEYFVFRILTTLIAVVVSGVVITTGGFTGKVSLVIAAITLAKACDSIADVFYGTFQQRESMDIIGKAMVINGVFSLFLAGFGMWLTHNIVVAAIGYALGSLIPLLAYVIPWAMKVRHQQGFRAYWWKWVPNQLTALLRLSLPLGIVMLLITLNANIPRYIIEYYLGSWELGVFAALSYLLIAGSTVVNAMGQAVSPRLAGSYAAGNQDAFVRMVRVLAIGGLVIGLIGFLLSLMLGRPVLSLMYTSAYASYIDVLAVLALGAGLMFAASILGYGLTAARQFDVQVPIFIVVLAACILSSLILIPSFGLMGAAISVGLTQGVNLVACWIVLVRTLKKQKVENG